MNDTSVSAGAISPQAAPPRPPTWNELRAKPEIQALPSEDIEGLRSAYFDEYVAPTIPKDDYALAREQWDELTRPGVISRVGHDVGRKLESLGLESAAYAPQPRLSEDAFTRAETRHGVPPGLLKKMADQESGGDPNAVSPKGAIGLMQFMPATAARLGVDPKNPASAIDGAGRYMGLLLKRYDGNLRSAVAAYNAGEGTVDDFLHGTNKTGKNPKLLTTADGIPPFAETQNYVRKILGDSRENMPQALRGLPVQPGAVDAVKAEYDQLGPAGKAKLVARDDWKGRIARVIDAQYRQADSVLAHDPALLETAHAMQAGQPLGGAATGLEEPWYDAARAGWARGKQGLRVLEAEMGLADPASPQFATELAQSQREVERYTPDPNTQKRLDEINALPTGAWLKALLANPDVVGRTILGSLGQSAPALAAAAAGSALGPGGTATGAGAGSFAVEYANSLVDALNEKGLDPNDARSWQALLTDPEAMTKARAFAAKRAVPVAAFDALTAGLAGRLLAGATPSAGSVAGRVAGELGLQAGGGMAGEAAAQAASGQPWDPKDVLMEGIAEMPTAAVEVPGNWGAAREAAQQTPEGRGQTLGRLLQAAVDQARPGLEADALARQRLMPESGGAVDRADAQPENTAAHQAMAEALDRAGVEENDIRPSIWGGFESREAAIKAADRLDRRTGQGNWLPVETGIGWVLRETNRPGDTPARLQANPAEFDQAVQPLDAQQESAYAARLAEPAKPQQAGQLAQWQGRPGEESERGRTDGRAVREAEPDFGITGGADVLPESAVAGSDRRGFAGPAPGAGESARETGTGIHAALHRAAGGDDVAVSAQPSGERAGGPSQEDSAAPTDSAGAVTHGGDPWDAMPPEARAQVAAQAGWGSKKNGPNAFARKLAAQPWAEIKPEIKTKLGGVLFAGSPTAPDSPVQSAVSSYEDRAKARLARIEAAQGPEEVAAIKAENDADPERSLAGVTRINAAAKKRAAAWAAENPPVGPADALPEGTRVVPAGAPNVWRDADGVIYADDHAAPIASATRGAINVPQPAAHPAVLEQGAHEAATSPRNDLPDPTQAPMAEASAADAEAARGRPDRLAGSENGQGVGAAKAAKGAAVDASTSGSGALDAPSELTRGHAPPKSNAEEETARGVALSSVREGKPGAGMPVAAVQRAVDAMLAKLPGVDMRVHVHENQASTGYGRLPRTVESFVQIPSDGNPATLHVVAENVSSRAALQRILREEIIGHYGLRKVLGRQHAAVLRAVKEAARANPAFRASWERLSGRTVDGKVLNARAPYYGKSDAEIADEVISKMAQGGVPEGARGRWKRILAAAIRALRVLRLAPATMTPVEAEALLVRAAEHLRKSHDRNAPRATSDTVAFSQQSLPPDEAANPDQLFSDIDAAVKRTRWEAVKQGAAEGWNKATGTARRQWLGGLTVHQLVDVSKDMLPGMRDYLDQMTRMDVTRGQILDAVDRVARDWEKLSRQEKARLAHVMHEATLAGVDPAEAYTPSVDVKAAGKQIDILKAQAHQRSGEDHTARMAEINHLRKQIAFEKERKAAYDPLRRLFNGLSPEAQEIYRRARDYHQEQSRRVEEALVELIGKTQLTGRQRADAVAKLRQEFESQRVQSPYFPLARQGDYWVYLKPGGAGDAPPEFHTFQTLEEQQDFMKAMRDEGAEILGRGKQLENLHETTGVSGSFVSQVQDIIGQLGEDNPLVQSVRDQVYQLYLATLPELSARKHFIHRKKTPGFGTDALRAFASKGYHDAYQYARLKHGFDMRQTMEALRAAIEAATSKPKLRELRERMSMLEEFRDSVMGKLSPKDTRDKAEAMKLQAVDGNAVSDAEAKKWAQFAEWMDDWTRYGGVPEQVSRELKTLAMQLDTQKRINADPRGYEFASNVYNELQSAYAWLMNPRTAPWAAALNQVGYLYSLAFSPAAWLTNATQNPVVTLPYVAAKFGMNRASKAFANAYREAFTPDAEHGFSIRGALKAGSEDLDAYDTAVARGLIDRTRAYDLAGLAEQGAARSGWYRRFAEAMGWGFHHAERLNRETAFMAAFRLARDEGSNFNEAVDYAADVVNKTHLVYTSENRPRVMRSDAARVLFQFKLYSQGITYLLAKAVHDAFKGASKEAKAEARRFLALQLGMQTAVAGAMGLPIGAVWWVAEAVFAGLADDDDDPKDLQAEFRQTLADLLGKTGGEAAAKGLVNALTPFDLHSRIGMRELWFRESDRDVEGRDAAWRLLGSIMGPMAGIVENAFIGAQLMGEGHFERGLEKLLPKAIRDPLKAMRYATEGAQTLKGDKLVDDVGTLAILGQALGFTPSKIADQYDENNARMNRETRLEDRRKTLTKRVGQAILDKDSAANAAAMAEVRAFNAKNRNMAITAQSIRQSVRGRLSARDMALNGVIPNKRLRKDLAERYDFAGE